MKSELQIDRLRERVNAARDRYYQLAAESAAAFQEWESLADQLFTFETLEGRSPIRALPPPTRPRVLR